jgi:hypothetical protein
VSLIFWFLERPIHYPLHESVDKQHSFANILFDWELGDYWFIGILRCRSKGSKYYKLSEYKIWMIKL